jgi:hypothetical protein
MKYAEIKDLYEECKENRKVLTDVTPSLINESSNRYELSLSSLLGMKISQLAKCKEIEDYAKIHKDSFMISQVNQLNKRYIEIIDAIDWKIDFMRIELRYNRIGETLGMFPSDSCAKWKLEQSIKALQNDKIVPIPEKGNDQY